MLEADTDADLFHCTCSFLKMHPTVITEWLQQRCSAGCACQSWLLWNHYKLWLGCIRDPAFSFVFLTVTTQYSQVGQASVLSRSVTNVDASRGNRGRLLRFRTGPGEQHLPCGGSLSTSQYPAKYQLGEGSRSCSMLQMQVQTLPDSPWPVVVFPDAVKEATAWNFAVQSRSWQDR